MQSISLADAQEQRTTHLTNFARDVAFVRARIRATFESFAAAHHHIRVPENTSDKEADSPRAADTAAAVSASMANPLDSSPEASKRTAQSQASPARSVDDDDGRARDDVMLQTIHDTSTSLSSSLSDDVDRQTTDWRVEHLRHSALEQVSQVLLESHRLRSEQRDHLRDVWERDQQLRRQAQTVHLQRRLQRKLKRIEKRRSKVFSSVRHVSPSSASAPPASENAKAGKTAKELADMAIDASAAALKRSIELERRYANGQGRPDAELWIRHLARARGLTQESKVGATEAEDSDESLSSSASSVSSLSSYQKGSAGEHVTTKEILKQSTTSEACARAETEGSNEHSQRALVEDESMRRAVKSMKQVVALRASFSSVLQQTDMARYVVRLREMEIALASSLLSLFLVSVSSLSRVFLSTR